MIGVRLHAHPTACHLHIQARAHRRAQHGDQVNVRVIEAGGQHIGVCQGSQAAGLEVCKDLLALFLRRLACHALGRNAVLL